MDFVVIGGIAVVAHAHIRTTAVRAAQGASRAELEAIERLRAEEGV
ncbi:MAG TPA: hypothetical protein VH247_06075 [Thermoleophilaceae bacterium]|nr:hypothetical protein [Thermoleophilaceae bacterium]